MGEREISEMVSMFYRTERAGAIRLSDGGGPFGFDIAVALIADDMIRGYECDAIVETGCFLGDTTSYLARHYPDLPVLACDIEQGCCAFTSRRLAGCRNLTVTCEDSPLLVARACTVYERPLLFLDAHWGDRWPLAAELDTVTAGVVMIHDFDIGHDRFSFDTYQGTPCGPGMLARMARPPEHYFTLDPGAHLPVPCLQTGRRAGVAVLAAALGTGPLDACPYLAAQVLHTEPEPAGASR